MSTDERDELTRIARVTRTGPLFSMTTAEAEAIADAILAAGYRKADAGALADAWDAGHRTCRLDPDSIEFNPYRTRTRGEGAK